MTTRFQKGTAIFRHWDSQDGLNEITRGFSSLDELFGLCLQTNNKLLIDRVVMDGQDAAGKPHTITLVFQSNALPDATVE
jgi:polyphosphate kinase 2 (PPK2 family)